MNIISNKILKNLLFERKRSASICDMRRKFLLNLPTSLVLLTSGSHWEVGISVKAKQPAKSKMVRWEPLLYYSVNGGHQALSLHPTVRKSFCFRHNNDDDIGLQAGHPLNSQTQTFKLNSIISASNGDAAWFTQPTISIQ